MADPRTAAPRPLSPEAHARLRSHLGAVNTAVLQRLDATLPWYRQLTPDERSALGLVAQRALQGFVASFERPTTTTGHVLRDVFGQSPTELTRAISLQRALQLIRTMVDVVESTVPDLVPDRDQNSLREHILHYSREIAFALADVYARAAEIRGAMDSRLEAVLLDAVLRGHDADEIRHRATALGWRGDHGVVVMAGAAPGEDGPGFVRGLRRAAARLECDLLVGVQAERLVLVAGSVTDPSGVAEALTPWFGEGPVIVGPVVESLVDAHVSARHALAALSAAPAHPRAARPTPSADLLPERALAGDPSAREALVEDVYTPLAEAGTALLETVDAFCCRGHSLEGTARELFIHANTVRYRLRRVAEITGWDPLQPREAYVLQTAVALGRLSAARTPG
ncbi:helix-turn-helix domain-containing protein [Micrococcus sp.]|uniref:PucR family transcriptional regulator n=1 Tax=Micrococcus sp. TaxID=1271 RepID=UPI002A90B0DA|nr:helix-turn-helix domain-containing protein [Micrococcus sp.]MDY6054314.1 helix-turn-helix domain-containing protein [Micrococcus sp.]